MLGGSIMNVRKGTAYGLGAVGKDMVYALVSGFLLYYYNTVLGISATFIGIIFMAARIFDAFNDPFMGIVVAKTRTRYGKFRPWILCGTILNAIVLYGMYAVPVGLSGKPLLIYVSVAYLLWGITYTVMDIPYWSMIPAITQSGKEREKISVIARSCAGLGAAFPTALTMALVPALGGGNERTGFKILAGIIAVFFVIAELITVWNVKEVKQDDTKSVRVKEMIKALMHNDQALVVVVSIVIFNASLYLTQQLGIYFFKFDIGKASLYGVFGMVGGAAQILSMVMLPVIRKKFQCKQILQGAIGMALTGYTILFALGTFGVKNMVALSFAAVIVFIGFGLATVLTTIFLADTVDYGEWKNSQRNESVIFSMQTFVVKLASAFSVLIAGVGLDLIHLDKQAAVQTAGTLLGLRVVMIVVPMAGLVWSSIFFTRRYRLTEDVMKGIITDLKGRNVEYDKEAK